MQTDIIVTAPKRKWTWTWVYDLLLLVVLLVGGYLRFSGSDWGELSIQHPDENFLESVTSALQPVHSLSEYFNTATSTLNPNNTGNGFYVYGTLPIFIVRGVADLTCEMSTWKLFGWPLPVTCRLNNLRLLGRQMSAVADLAAVLLLYFIVKRLYGRRVALLAAMFSALAVMQIQQSHFYTTDNFATFFMFLTTFFAVEIMAGSQKLEKAQEPSTKNKFLAYFEQLIHERILWLSAAFGLALGMAMASKLNAAPIAVLLPIALIVRYFADGRSDKAEIDGSAEGSAGTPVLIHPRSFGDFIAKYLIILVVGAVFALLAFRVFQPYAFSGWGLNPQWVANIKEQRAQATPNSDLPWALQWAKRTHLYSFENLTVWGLGLPLGILAWVGFLWMGWRIVRGEWRKHILLWGWTAAYFIWQSLQYNPTMRYQLPIYPLLAMMAAWLVFWLWDKGREKTDKKRWTMFYRLSSVFLGAVVLVLTAAWAYAFSKIYIHPEPRVAASNWIFQHVPGPINLPIQAADGSIYQQPLAFPWGTEIRSEAPYVTAFNAQADGLLDQVFLSHIARLDTSPVDLRVTIWQDLNDPQPLASSDLSLNSSASTDSAIQTFPFQLPPALVAQNNYYIKVESLTPSVQVNLCGPLQLAVTTPGGAVEQEVGALPQCVISVDQPYLTQFIAQSDGNLTQIVFAHAAIVTTPGGVQTINLSLASAPDPQSGQILANATVTADFTPSTDPRGNPATLMLDRPVTIQKNTTYYLSITTTGSPLTLVGSAVTSETEFDYTIPFYVSGYNPYHSGLYTTPVINGYENLEVYWPDNADKLARYENILDQIDYIFIPTAHQYTQITRLPERYPLTTVFYRELLGCPAEKNINWCYRVAEPGMFRGSLGFDLVAVFTSYPTIGPLQINDQSVEEAFWFYDHPKTMVFKKNADYAPAKVQAILGAVDTSTAIQLTPGQASKYKSLMLPADQLASQQAGGTWSDLFNRDAFYNRYPGLGVVLWYLFVFALGLLVYPLVRAAFPGLPDHGYPLARIVGLLLWSWFAWMAGSIGLSYSKPTIGIALGLVALLGLWQAWRQRVELRQEFKERWKYFLMVEIIFLSFFLLDLFIRLGNPDLWHPAKGGERPMDFAYFNAVLKSTSFPPYDPWFAGGYINYYYYGYVIVGTPVKLLGIVPSIAYNFILPTLFACFALSAFSVGWNLLAGIRNSRDENRDELQVPQSESQITDSAPRSSLFDSRFIAGISASSAMVLLGNLGVVQMLYKGFQMNGAPGGIIEGANLLEKIWWTVKGLFLTLAGAHLPYGPGDWYWNPSRIFPPGVSEFYEFPIFTFIYSDLHAHMIALMLTVLVISWGLSVLLSKGKWNSPVNAVLGFFMGGLIIGSLKPTNTWDFYTYLVLGAAILAYTVCRYSDTEKLRLSLPGWGKRILLAGGAVAVLAALSVLLYQPFSHWFGQAYTSIVKWTGTRTPISVYLIQWGVFLFFIVSWMAWETRQWLAETPVSSLSKLRPYRELIIFALATVVVALVAQQAWVMSSSQASPWKGITIVWLALPLAVWAAVLILRPGLSDLKRLVLFMIGTGLLLTMVVEFIVITGDIERMNTVYKFGVQTWVLLGISAAAGFGWLLAEFRKWLPGWRVSWQVLATVLTAGAALFLLMGGMGKIRDRMTAGVPHTLDSMTYMAYAHYNEYGVDMDLSEDYRAILWLQDNVQGSPVIAEAAPAGVQYAWLGRFSIYTGLPDVVGWEWHQIQQRVADSNTVRMRGIETDAFYTTTDPNAARDFLRKYNVHYIIVGLLERAKYIPLSSDGLNKFDVYNGMLWREVYRDGQTVIYEVIPSS